MILVRSTKAMQKKARERRYAGKSIGFVPTMGALHEGHLSLIRRASRENDITVVSIFVNPTQFGPNEDYKKYPRTLKKDLDALKPLSIDFVFAPDTSEIYPSEFQTLVNIGEFSKPMCGPFRPGHFQGVATVVLKLFNLVMPTRAYFGQKDFQQLRIIQQLVKDLHLPIEIVPCPIVREKDGLAMSSRNAYLSTHERKIAPEIFKALSLGKALIQNGEKNPKIVQKTIETHLRKLNEFSIDYVAVVDPQTLLPPKTIGKKTLLAIAARLGKTRLIDNILLDRL